MKRLLFQNIFILLLATTSKVQLKVANYSLGKFGTNKYEHFEFWTKDGKSTNISYAYGKGPKEVKLRFLGKDQINGDSCLKVEFSNKYVLYIIPNKLRLEITDSSGDYHKIFEWEYEGPVNGIGTYCDFCTEDEEEAMQLIHLAYLK